MKIKHDDIVIDAETPFANCKLGRQKQGDTLTKIVANYKDGFVLAINNEWGTGKTTFVKMWQQQLVLDGYQTVYFNAWENDFEINPMVAIMSEFKVLTKVETKDTFKSLIAKGATLSKNIFPALIKAIASKYIDSNVIVDFFENTTKGATDIFEDEMKSYSKKKESINDFRLLLSKFIEVSTNEKPVIFIIDELDRCRPNYAVELLEQVKHIFLVRGIVFVLSIDKEQLGHAVRGVYGSDLINANEYLRRFIDLEYSLQTPDTKLFCEYLFSYFEFQTFFHSQVRKQFREFDSEKNDLIAVASTLFEKAGITLRQQEKIFVHTRIGLLFFQSDHYLFPDLFLILVFLKTFHTGFYEKVKQKMFSTQQMIDEFSKFIPKGLNSETVQHFIRVEAIFAFLYNNYSSEYGYACLIETNQETKVENSILKSNLEAATNNSFFRNLKYLDSESNYRNVSLLHLLSKVDLTGNITI